VAGKAQDAAAAQGRRIGAELGLGEYLGSWNGSKLKARVMMGWILIVLVVLASIKVLASLLHSAVIKQDDMSDVGGMAILLAIGVPMVAIPPLTKRAWLHRYEAGLAEVTGRRRVAVLRWANLASLSLRVVKGYDDEYIRGCELRDHSGTVVTVDDERYGPAVRELVTGLAEQVLTGRLVGPLTARLDQGLPVTVGSLTVDRSGISCQGGQAGGSWNVPWQQARGIATELRGHRVSVDTDRRGRHAALAGQPNDFLASYVLEHAAARAGVPFLAR
jgi:hypothetical protein